MPITKTGAELVKAGAWELPRGVRPLLQGLYRGAGGLYRRGIRPAARAGLEAAGGIGRWAVRDPVRRVPIVGLGLASPFLLRSSINKNMMHADPNYQVTDPGMFRIRYNRPENKPYFDRMNLFY